MSSVTFCSVHQHRTASCGACAQAAQKRGGRSTKKKWQLPLQLLRVLPPPSSSRSSQKALSSSSSSSQSAAHQQVSSSRETPPDLLTQTSSSSFALTSASTTNHNLGVPNRSPPSSLAPPSSSSSSSALSPSNNNNNDNTNNSSSSGSCSSSGLSLSSSSGVKNTAAGGSRPLTFHSVLTPTPESPVTERRLSGPSTTSSSSTSSPSSSSALLLLLPPPPSSQAQAYTSPSSASDRSGFGGGGGVGSEGGGGGTVGGGGGSGGNEGEGGAGGAAGQQPAKGATLSATLLLRGLNVSPGMSIRRKILPHKRKLVRGMTCDTILFRPPPDIVPPRRLSSGSLTSGSENEAEHEPSPPVARRGRRSAIYETKNCGDVSPTTLSPEHSPSNSCDEGEGASNIAERLRRRRSSVDLAMNIYPGDLLVQEHHKKLIKRNTIADFYAGRSPSEGPAVPADSTDVSKKGRQPFSLLKLMKTRSKENLTRLDDILRRLKPSEFKDNHLAAYKIVHWSDLIASTDKQNPPISISDTERKRREAVWELFKSECVFLIDHLMVLKHCFMEPLKKVQVEGSLMFAEPQDIFGNLDELCYVSYTFCKDFIAALLKDMSGTDFGRTKVLIKAFQRFSTHSKDGAVFHTYCINYANALSYLDKLRQNPEFVEFERWCEQDPRCNRLQLTDLLVAPMQHCTKLPLLLANVRKYTESEMERQMVTESIEKVETSLKQLEDKMKWIKNVERVQEIQNQIIWPAVAELDPRCVIPDCLKATLSKQPCERLLSCTKRQLLHEGPLTLMESPKPIDVHVFLFDDLLLITKIKKTPRKQKQGSSDVGAKSPSGGAGDRASYVVFRQPLAMDRFTLHDIAPADASASGLKNLMVLVHISRFQQVIGLFSLQAACDAGKVTWLNHIREAKERYAESQTSRQNSFKENKDPRVSGNGADGGSDPFRSAADFMGSGSGSRSPSRRVKRNSLQRKVPSKSRSMDAVFI